MVTILLLHVQHLSIHGKISTRWRQLLWVSRVRFIAHVAHRTCAVSMVTVELGSGSYKVCRLKASSLGYPFRLTLFMHNNLRAFCGQYYFLGICSSVINFIISVIFPSSQCIHRDTLVQFLSSSHHWQTFSPFSDRLLDTRWEFWTSTDSKTSNSTASNNSALTWPTNNSSFISTREYSSGSWKNIREKGSRRTTSHFRITNQYSIYSSGYVSESFNSLTTLHKLCQRV